jgi:hypothetical protein
LFQPFTIVLGLCLKEHKMILMDQRNNALCSERERDETLAHELSHFFHGPGEAHGPNFTDTLSRVKAFLFPNPEATVTGRAGGAP